jgi:hypothetical protein
LSAANILVGAKGVRIIDSSEPDFPAEVAAFPMENIGTAFKVKDGLGFAGLAHESRLVVLDLHDPKRITEIGHLDLPDVVHQIDVAGNILHLLVRNQGMLAVDISDPAHPYAIGWLPTRASAFALEDEVVYLAETGCYTTPCGTTLMIVDFSNPRLPTEKASIFFESHSSTGISVDNHVVALLAGSLLRFVDVSLPEHPVGYGSFGTSGFSDWLVTDNLLLATDFYNVHAANISSLSEPVLLSKTPTDAVAVSITLGDKKRYAFVGWSDEVAAIDLRDLRLPRRIGGYPAYGGSTAEVSSGLVYIHDSRYIRVIDFGPE